LKESGLCDRVWIVTESDMPPGREGMGWAMDHPTSSEVRMVAPRRVDDVLREAHPAAIHVVSGLATYEVPTLAAERAQLYGNLTLAYSEAPRLDGWRAAAALVKALNGRLRAVKPNGALATGHAAGRWLTRAGIPAYKILPFGYFVQAAQGTRTVRNDELFCVCFVGQHVHRKAGDVLLKALAHLVGFEWRAVFIGDGPERLKWQSLCQEHGLQTRVEFRGNLLHRDTLHAIAQGDVLVLPSRYDGWGAVVNEALTVGVPVIVSDASGASALIENDHGNLLGEVVPAGSVKSLTAALARAMSKGQLRDTTRGEIANWAQVTISPSAVALYLYGWLSAATNGEWQPQRAPWD
jgi:glycosyltransferase involved in cell wall biosynthesis